MGKFISDAELAAIEKKQPKKFISDEELKKIESRSQAEPYDYANLPKDLVETGIDQLPLIGATIGGVAGAFTGPAAPVASIGLAAGGSMAGQSLKDTINAYRGKQAPASLAEIVKAQAIAGAEGAAQEFGGQYLDKGFKVAGKALKNTAENLQFKSLGAMLKDWRSANSNEIGRHALDNYATPFSDFDRLAVGAEKDLSKRGADLSSVYSKAEEIIQQKASKTGFDPIRDKFEVLSAVRNELGESVGADAAVEQVSKYLDEVASRHGDSPMRSAVAKYKQEVSDYLPKFRTFLKEKKLYQKSLGQAGEDLNQPVLPGVFDDFQRSKTESLPIEVHGKDPVLMRANESDFANQMSLFPLPERAQGIFNSTRGDDLLPLQHQMVMDNVSTNRYLTEGQQGFIEGTELVPRSFVNAEGQVIQQGSGQMQFSMPPIAPQRPVRPDDIRNNMSPTAARSVKSAMDEAINYSRNPLAKEPTKEVAFSAARNKVNEKIMQQMEEVGGPELAQSLRDANKKFSLSKGAIDVVKDRLAREEAKKSAFGLTDTIAGTGATAYGLATGDWSGAAAIFAGKKYLEKYGAQQGALAADFVSKQLLNSPQGQALAQRLGPAGFRMMVDKYIQPNEEKNKDSSPMSRRLGELNK